MRIPDQHKSHSLYHFLGSLFFPPSMTLPKSHFHSSNHSQQLTAGMEIILFQLDAAETHWSRIANDRAQHKHLTQGCTSSSSHKELDLWKCRSSFSQPRASHREHSQGSTGNQDKNVHGQVGTGSIPCSPTAPELLQPDLQLLPVAEGSSGESSSGCGDQVGNVRSASEQLKQHTMDKKSTDVYDSI